MTESELYRELGALTKRKDEWETNIPYVSSLLNTQGELLYNINLHNKGE